MTLRSARPRSSPKPGRLPASCSGSVRASTTSSKAPVSKAIFPRGKMRMGTRCSRRYLKPKAAIGCRPPSEDQHVDEVKYGARLALPGADIQPGGSHAGTSLFRHVRFRKDRLMSCDGEGISLDQSTRDSAHRGCPQSRRLSGGLVARTHQSRQSDAAGLDTQLIQTWGSDRYSIQSS